MTQDEIIKMAREAGGCEIGYGSTLWVGTQSTEFLEAFAKLVAAKEREACAKVADGWPDYDVEGLASPLTKAIKQSHQNEVDAIVKDSDRAFDLLRRAETEMRYAGWTKYEADNSARNGVYEQIKQFLEKPQ